MNGFSTLCQTHSYFAVALTRQHSLPACSIWAVYAAHFTITEARFGQETARSAHGGGFGARLQGCLVWNRTALTWARLSEDYRTTLDLSRVVRAGNYRPRIWRFIPHRKWIEPERRTDHTKAVRIKVASTGGAGTCGGRTAGPSPGDIFSIPKIVTKASPLPGKFGEIQKKTTPHSAVEVATRYRFHSSINFSIRS